MHLFDTCIKPILTYGSEIWTPYFGTKNIMNMNNKTENVQLQCSKWALNVAKNCSNLGVLGELGRNPLLKDAQLNAIKYWVHIQNIPKTRLLYKVYELAKSTKSKWYTYIVSSLENIGIEINDLI